MGISGLSVTNTSSVDAEAILKLLANPDSLKANIEAYNVAKKAAEDAVAVHGKASQIPTLRDEAKKLRDEARDIADSASADAANSKAESKKSLDEAKKKAAEIVEAAKSQADALVAKAKAMSDEAQKTKADGEAYADKIKGEADSIYS
jgi:dsDNA-specific endonuclease/ATPase MutS2